MEMEEKNSGSTCERFLGAVRRSLVHSAQFLQMGVLLSNEERDVEGMVSLKKNSSSFLEREKPPLRELNLLKKKENFIYSHDNYFPPKFFTILSSVPLYFITKMAFLLSRSFNTFSNSKNKFLPLITRQLINKNLETASQFAKYRYIFHTRTVKP